jgi:hypothetical protein
MTPFLFELNTERTRVAAESVISGVLVDLIGKEAITDFVISLDRNTPDVIARNQLIIDVLIQPTRSINFILVNLRLRNPSS